MNKSEQNYTLDLPNNALGITHGQRIDIKESMQAYCEAIGDDTAEETVIIPELRAMCLHIVDAEYFDAIFKEPRTCHGLMVVYCKASKQRTEKFVPSTDLEHLIARAIDRLKTYRPVFADEVLAQTLGGSWHEYPHTALPEEYMYALEGLTLEQTAIAIWPELLHGRNAHENIKKKVQEKREELRNLTLDTSMYLYEAVVGFIRAERAFLNIKQ